MPGWMGLRGVESKNPHDMERSRREEHRGGGDDVERRSEEKVREILRHQEGDMAAYTGQVGPEHLHDCDGISALPVRNIMSGRVAVLSFDDTLLTVQGIFDRVRFHHLPVVDDQGDIIGILSDRDFLRMVSPFFGTINEQNRDKEIMTRRVGMVMTRNPVCASAETTILDAIRTMMGRKISCLPIVDADGKQLLGIITWKDVVRAFCPRGFASPHDSNRLKSGVDVNARSSESARVQSKAAESARLKAREAAPREKPGDTALLRPPNRDTAVKAAARDPQARERRPEEETSILRAVPSPKIAAQEKLRPRNSAGKAGSDLAAKQRARMREQVQENKRALPSESARLIIEPDEDGI